MACQNCERNSMPRVVVRDDSLFEFCDYDCLMAYVEKVCNTSYRRVEDEGAYTYCSQCGTILMWWYFFTPPTVKMLEKASAGNFCSTNCIIQHVLNGLRYMKVTLLSMTARGMYKFLRDAAVVNALQEKEVYEILADLEGRDREYYKNFPDHSLVSIFWALPERGHEVMERAVKVVQRLR